MNQGNSRHGIWAVVPVKRFDRAKRRLSLVLNSDERRRLSLAMLDDVLDAVSNSSRLSGFVVVTCEREAMGLAENYRAEVLSEKSSRGLCQAVATAAEYLDARGCAGMIYIPGDVPLAGAEEIDRVIFNHRPAPAVTLVPDWDGGGTNALLCSPVDAVSPQFGENSFSAHQDATRKAHMEPTVVPAPGLELDLDTPNDLRAFLERGSNTRTARYLEEIRLAERLDADRRVRELKRGLG